MDRITVKKGYEEISEVMYYIHHCLLNRLNSTEINSFDMMPRLMLCAEF